MAEVAQKIMTRIFSQEKHICNQFVAELRDVKVQGDRLRFRRNLERIGEVMAMEIAKTLEYQNKTFQTPLGESEMMVPTAYPVLGTILRAGVPMHQGMLNVFDKAESFFISAYRKHHKDGTFEVAIEYVSGPDINNRVMVLCDPMLATGASLLRTYEAVRKHGEPSHLHVVAAIASMEGLNISRRDLPSNTSFWIGDLDDELTAESYIVPGLGDAGDLAYGNKV